MRKEPYFNTETSEQEKELKEFKRIWFKDMNLLCKKCKRKCKQSSKVVIENCDQFIAKI